MQDKINDAYEKMLDESLAFSKNKIGKQFREFIKLTFEVDGEDLEELTREMMKLAKKAGKK